MRIVIRSVADLCGCAHCSLTQAKAARNQDVKPKATTKAGRALQTIGFHPNHRTKGRGVATKSKPQERRGASIKMYRQNQPVPQARPGGGGQPVHTEQPTNPPDPQRKPRSPEKQSASRPSKPLRPSQTPLSHKDRSWQRVALSGD